MMAKEIYQQLLISLQFDSIITMDICKCWAHAKKDNRHMTKNDIYKVILTELQTDWI